MAKYQSGNYIQIPRNIFEPSFFSELSPQACKLYLWLKELEHKYCGLDHNAFFHTDAEIASEINVSTKWVERHRKELIEKNILEFTREHFTFSDTGKKSEKRVGCYKFKNN